jgi:predicted nucleic acid-binding protein
LSASTNEPFIQAATGGGLSALFPSPGFQSGISQSLLNGARGLPDLSWNAEVDGGVLVYTSFPGARVDWHIVGGTSASSPQLAVLITNIFVYSFDDNQPEKKKRSIALIQEGLKTGLGLISSQVVQEFLNVATRKFSVPMKLEDSKVYLRLVMNPLCRVYPNLLLFEACLDLQSETRYSFYDSLIIAAAIQARCDILYSEDLQDDQELRGLKIVNPYR